MLGKLQKLHILEKKGIEHYYGCKVPSYVLEAGAKQYAKYLTPNELSFYLNSVHLNMDRNLVLHLYHTETKSWFPLDISFSAGALGGFGTTDIPNYIIDKVIDGLDKDGTLELFDLQISTLSWKTACVDLYNWKEKLGHKTKDDYFEYLVREQITGMNMNSQIFGVRKKEYTVEFIDYKNGKEWFEDLFIHCPNWLDKWHYSDPNAHYYQSMADLFSMHACKITFETGGFIYYFFLRDGNNWISADPIVKENIDPATEKRLRPFALLHLYLIKYAIDNDIRYADFGWMYVYKQFLNFEWETLQQVESKVDFENPYKVLQTTIKEARLKNQRIIYAPLCNDGSPLALQYNMRETVDTKVIIIPAKNTVQHPIELQPFVFDLDPLSTFIELKENDYIYDADYINLDYFLKNNLIKTPYAHSNGARRIETDRLIGKEVAKNIGLNVPVYSSISDIDDWEEVLEIFEGIDSVALKTHAAFITKMPLKNAKEMVASLIKSDGVVILEEDLGEAKHELAFAFGINGDYVIPLHTLWEQNKIFTNNLGGKVGSTQTLQIAGIPDIFQNVVNSMNRIYEVYPEQFFGWVDCSLMYSEKKKGWYFTEFMCRMGFSNTLSIFRHMKTPYSVFLDALKNKDPEFKIEWKTKYSAGVDLHAISMPTNDGGVRVYDVKHVLNRGNNTDTFFDMMFPALYYNGDQVYANKDSWYGVCTGLSDRYSQAFNRAFALAQELVYELPYCAFKQELDIPHELIKEL